MNMNMDERRKKRTKRNKETKEGRKKQKEWNEIGVQSVFVALSDIIVKYVYKCMYVLCT